MQTHPRTIIALLNVLLFCAAPFSSSAAAQQPTTAPAQNRAAPPKSSRAYSGMYSFLKEGEFVQVSVEDGDRVSGFISRYEDEDSQQGAFIDQFFKTAKLDGNKLTFTTKTVHGVWFDFDGTIERGEGSNPGDEAYYLLKGTLTLNSSDADKKVTSQKREVEFKAFPQNASSHLPR